MTNFGAALKDCTVYAHLLTAVAPPSEHHLVAGLSKAVAIEKDPIAKAQVIIDAATQLGVTQFRLMPADIAKGHEKLNMAFAAAIFNHLPGLAASELEGVFNPALACASAVIKDGGRTVQLSETGSALFGGKMDAHTGTHWALLKVVQASEPQVYVGLAPPTVYKAGVVGLEAQCLGGGHLVVRGGLLFFSAIFVIQFRRFGGEGRVVRGWERIAVGQSVS